MPRLNVKRLLFLSVIAAVFLFAYIADLNIFAAILQAIAVAAPYVDFFMKLFLVLSFAGLSVYYYLAKISNREISLRFLAWLKVISWSCFAAFLLSCMIIYMNIYFNTTFDNT